MLSERKARRTFDTQHVCQPDDGLLIDVRRDVGHQGEVLDETARLAFGGVAGTKHSPLTRLQRSRSTHLPRLLELGADAGHHAQCADEREPAEDVRDACPLHLEPLQRPVPGGDRTDEARSNMVALELHRVERVKF